MRSIRVSREVYLAAGLLLGAAVASRGDLEFTDIRVFPGDEHHTVHLTTQDGTNLTTRFTVRVPVTDDTSWVYAALHSNAVPDRLYVEQSREPEARPWTNLSLLEVSPVLMLVPHSGIDQAFYEANSNANPNGFGNFQKDGPAYSFFMGKYEVINGEFVRFLNDAQANTNNARGAFMFFDSSGYVRFSPNGAGQIPSDYDLFDIATSPIVYSNASAIGQRYSCPTGLVNHPVIAVSWYGALKYCNWLTLDTGLGESERCYHEGFDPSDWYPVTATNWPTFTEAERSAWVTNYAGFRLPMVYETATEPTAFNEFYRAAAWNGSENTVYGFGRSSISGVDANYQPSGDPFDTTAPVGFYDGLNINNGSTATHSNANRHAIYDLSGNVNEWMNDAAFSSGLRDFRGGGYLSSSSLLKSDAIQAGTPRNTSEHIGFRVCESTELRAGTNVNEAIPLTVFPSFASISTTQTLSLTGVGGTGTNGWTLSEMTLGGLSTATGTVVVYTPVQSNGTQFVVLSDGLIAVTSTVLQSTSGPPPPPP